METDRSKICGCKGIRTCLKCEQLFNIQPKYQQILSTDSAYFYCHLCDLCWPGWNCSDHSNHTGEPIRLEGVHLIENFISKEEETQLISDLDSLPWEFSQSGRRKQNFGPKCNFKKRKLRAGNFKGFPVCTKFIHEKFKTTDILKDFCTIEQCTLEYDANRGASIDPHIDDCWIWGERIVTVNLLEDSVLTLTPYQSDDNNKYNLNFAPEQYRYGAEKKSACVQVIRIPLIKRSLLVLTGEARYCWLHQIYRQDVPSRRLCLAFREFTPAYLPGGIHSDEGENILELSKNFWELS
ncbi:hypothetical protein O3M35_001289 [Rhynocoris fuscipes]|uniref:Uncharacterized protein n=1 Tax=Rhynocoris fuscipes TaxID=488301 RepID=A0AAW1DU86_9HEMI